MYKDPKNDISGENLFSNKRKHIIVRRIENIGTTKNIPFSPKIPINNARSIGSTGGTSPGYPLK
jgi:hypothetical protein